MTKFIYLFTCTKGMSWRSLHILWIYCLRPLFCQFNAPKTSWGHRLRYTHELLTKPSLWLGVFLWSLAQLWTISIHRTASREKKTTPAQKKNFQLRFSFAEVLYYLIVLNKIGSSMTGYFSSTVFGTNHFIITCVNVKEEMETITRKEVVNCTIC